MTQSDLVNFLKIQEYNLQKINYSKIQRPIFCANDLRCAISEQLILETLTKTNFNFFKETQKIKNYDLIKNFNGIEIKEEKKTIHEFDFLGWHNNKLYVGEIKTLKLNGYLQKIKTAFDLITNIFEERPIFLLCLPLRYNLDLNSKISEFSNYNLNVIDTKYSKKDLEKAITNYYNQL